MQKNLPSKNGQTTDVVFQGIDEHPTAVNDFLEQVASTKGIATIDPLRHAANDDVAVATVTFVDDGTSDSYAHRQQTANSLLKMSKQLDAAGVNTSFSGGLFTSSSAPSSELIGIVAALIILVFAFGSVVAAGLPLLVALFGVGIAIPFIGILTNFVKMGDVTSQVATMIGIGVGIDYTLLVVSRYRTALLRHGNPETAIVEAIDTAGRAVLLAGSTVIISLCGLFLIGMQVFTGLAVGAAIAVLIVVLTTLTLAPAILGFIGNNISRLHLGRRSRQNRLHEAGTPNRQTLGTRWATVVRKHPRPLVAISVLFLLTLAIPFGAMHLATADDGVQPKGSTTRTAYDTISQAFGAGEHAPFLVVIQSPNNVASAEYAIAATLRNTPGIVAVSDATTAADGKVVVFTATPSTGPADRATEKLFQHLRQKVLPPIEKQTGTQVHLGGETASNVDFAKLCADRLPWFIGAVLTLSFLLLMVMFRSVVIPLKAVALNLLSIGAAYGLMVAVFQWGWAAHALGASPGPVAPWIPTLLFAIVFGLSMDYEIFLLTSIREAHHQHGDTAQAVFTGLNNTARIITAAALIMSVVFGSFITMDGLSLKMIGFGLASAILIDATIVRMVLLPAVMTWLGEANWWMPFTRSRRDVPAPSSLHHAGPLGPRPGGRSGEPLIESEA